MRAAPSPGNNGLYVTDKANTQAFAETPSGGMRQNQDQVGAPLSLSVCAAGVPSLKLLSFRIHYL
jgi:hypothetical protein